MNDVVMNDIITTSVNVCEGNEAKQLPCVVMDMSDVYI